MKLKIVFYLLSPLPLQVFLFAQSTYKLKIDSEVYFEKQVANVVAFDVFYSQNNQSITSILQNGICNINNGNIRLPIG